MNKSIEERVERELVFKKPITDDELFKALIYVGDKTNSRFSIGYDKRISYSPNKNFTQKTYPHLSAAEGSIHKNNDIRINLDISANAYDNEQDRLQKYFDKFTLYEPAGWSGGDPSIRDRELLEEYADSVVQALMTNQPDIFILSSSSKKVFQMIAVLEKAIVCLCEYSAEGSKIS